jgi:hypothetical protein
VVDRGPTLVLDLGDMADTTELEAGYAEIRAVAATVLLDRIHGSRAQDPFALVHDEPRSGQLIRRVVTDRAALT